MVAQGYPNLTKGRATHAAQEFPNLMKGMAIRESRSREMTDYDASQRIPKPAESLPCQSS